MFSQGEYSAVGMLLCAEGEGVKKGLLISVILVLTVPSKVHPILQYTSIYENLRIFDQEVRYCTHCVRLYGSKRPK